MPLPHHRKSQSAQVNRSSYVKSIPPFQHSATQLNPLQPYFSLSTKFQHHHYQLPSVHSFANSIKTRQNRRHHLQLMPYSFKTPCMCVHPCPSLFRFTNLVNGTQCPPLQSPLTHCLPLTSVAKTPYSQVSISLSFPNINKS